MIYDIIIDTLLFGASGYITNKYVMDMLLNEYPISKSLKIGGKLKVSKKQFIKNVSNMMEKDILSSEKISEKFKNHDFSEEFISSVSRFSQSLKKISCTISSAPSFSFKNFVA